MMDQRKIKILRITNRFNVGGPTYNVAYLSKYLPEHYETTLIGGNVEPHEESSSYILDALKLEYRVVSNMHRAIHPLNDWKALQEIKSIIETEKPDIVHTHAAKAGALGRMAAYLANHTVPVVVHTYHGSVFEGYFSPAKARVFLEIERFLARKSTAIVAISDLQKNDLVNKYKIASDDKIHVIPLGFDLERFTQDVDIKRAKFRSEFDLEDDDIAITITGRLTQIKNHELFFRVFKNVESSGIHKIKAFVVGDGEDRDHLMNYCDSIGLTYTTAGNYDKSASVCFTSWRKDIDVINAGSDIVMLTSKNEGTPVSIIEAMASGRAVLSTDVGGVRDIIENQVSGIITENSDAALTDALMKLVKDSTFRDRLAECANPAVLSKFSYHRLASDTSNFYAKLLNNWMNV